MDTVLVDTDVFSFLLKNDTRASFYRKHLDNRRHALAFMTVAELRSWRSGDNGARRSVRNCERACAVSSSSTRTRRSPSDMRWFGT